MALRIVSIKAQTPIVDRGALERELRRALVDQKASGVRYMATYPPQAPGSTYKRTGSLMRSWHLVTPIVRTATEMYTEIASQGQIAPYNTKVQGEDQDPFFAGRGWRNVDTLERKVQKEFAPRVQKAIDRAAKA